MTSRTTKWLIGGICAGFLLGALDCGAIIIGAKTMFFTQMEMIKTALLAFFICLGAGAISGLLVGLFLETLSIWCAPGRALHGPWRREFAIATPLALLCMYLLFQLTSGPQASQIPLREIIVIGLGLGIGILTTIVGKRLLGFAQKGTTAAAVVLVGSFIISILLHIVDWVVLVRLYPPFHVALTVIALVVVILGTGTFIKKPAGKIQTVIVYAVVALCIAAMGTSIFILRHRQNPRFVVSQKTAAAADIVELAKRISPPPPEITLDAPENETIQAKVKENASQANISMPGTSVFLISVDAMRYDRVAFPGLKRQVAPSMGTLAKSSVVFSRAYTAVPHTSYAISSLLTGKYTLPLFDVPGAPTVHETWPEIMQRFRYRTGAFFTKAVFFIDRARFEPYLKKAYGFGYAKMDYEIPADERVSQAIEFLDKYKGTDTPVFTWTHFFEPHEPYDKQCTMYGKDNESRYDCEISTVDKSVGRYLQYIETNFPESIIIVTADHGEEFGDHGGKYHGTTLYDEQARVPLFIRIPGIPHRIVKQPVSLVDLLGTTLSMLDIPIPPRVRSNNMVDLILNDNPKDRAAFSENHGKKMVVANSHKLIWDRENQIARLYDLEKDPLEKISIADSQPKTVAALKAKIRRWEKSHSPFELRPIETESGHSSWPIEIQKALGGDDSTLPALTKLLDKETEPSVRHKAAELIAQLWKERPIGDLPELHKEMDPVVQGWLLVTRYIAGDSTAPTALGAITKKLDTMSLLWVQTILIRMESGDRTAIDGAMAIVPAKQVQIVHRQKAIALLGEQKIQKSSNLLLAQINNYQLSQDVVRALGNIAQKSFIDQLVNRLKRERFPERRAVVAAALANIGGNKVTAPIATEMGRKEPLPNALELLLQLKKISKTLGTASDPQSGKSVHYWTGLNPVTLSANRVSRVVIQTTGNEDGGSVHLLCNGVVAKKMPINRGTKQQHANLTSCGSKNDKMEIELQLVPEGVSATIDAAAIVTIR